MSQLLYVTNLFEEMLSIYNQTTAAMSHIRSMQDSICMLICTYSDLSSLVHLAAQSVLNVYVNNYKGQVLNDANLKCCNEVVRRGLVQSNHPKLI